MFNSNYINFKKNMKNNLFFYYYHLFIDLHFRRSKRSPLYIFLDLIFEVYVKFHLSWVSILLSFDVVEPSNNLIHNLEDNHIYIWIIFLSFLN